ncbi:MAG TPA: ZIP family metal transporter [Burkholderiales bacterium]|jgi:zinc and cadmium transporter|nr:ZIP family metal transporter [Burkholderiales bacterium]
MMTLVYISAASLIGGLLSVGLAALVSFATRAHWVNSLISFAIGALLGAAFLEVLPYAFGNSTNIQGTAATVLGGILAFFVLEKLVLWRHCHVEDCEAHGSHEGAHAHVPVQPQHDHGRSGLMIMVGDSFHNFVDGVLIAAAFMESTALGLVTATAVIAHEIPQEVGDFLILLHSGYTKTRAFVLNLLSSLMMVVGAIGAYFALQLVGEWVNTLLALAAASMIYVAVADLIPGLHKRPELAATAQQVLLILLGIACVWIVGELAHAH